MALEENLIEAPAIIQRLDLLGVTARYGCHHIGVHDAGFHPIHVAPELQTVGSENVRRIQPSLVQDRGIPAPLVLKVMNGIDDACRPMSQKMAIGCTQVGSAGGRLPIVEVDDVGSKRKLRQRFKQASAKQEETPLLVALVKAQVDALMPTKAFLIVKQVDSDWRIGKHSLPDRHGSVEPCYEKRAHDSRVFECPIGGINTPVAGQKDAHLVPQSCQFFGQAPDDVGHAAFLGKGSHLGCDHQNL